VECNIYVGSQAAGPDKNEGEPICAKPAAPTP
jgi:hypothetical protein